MKMKRVIVLGFLVAIGIQSEVLCSGGVATTVKVSSVKNKTTGAWEYQVKGGTPLQKAQALKKAYEGLKENAVITVGETLRHNGGYVDLSTKYDDVFKGKVKISIANVGEVVEELIVKDKRQEQYSKAKKDYSLTPEESMEVAEVNRVAPVIAKGKQPSPQKMPASSLADVLLEFNTMKEVDRIALVSELKGQGFTKEEMVGAMQGLEYKDSNGGFSSGPDPKAFEKAFNPTEAERTAVKIEEARIAKIEEERIKAKERLAAKEAAVKAEAPKAGQSATPTESVDGSEATGFSDAVAQQSDVVKPKQTIIERVVATVKGWVSSKPKDGIDTKPKKSNNGADPVETPAQRAASIKRAEDAAKAVKDAAQKAKSEQAQTEQAQDRAAARQTARQRAAASK